jgi:hypothetical protein
MIRGRAEALQEASDDEPTELDDTEASGYWAEVLTVARALISVYKPRTSPF